MDLKRVGVMMESLRRALDDLDNKFSFKEKYSHLKLMTTEDRPSASTQRRKMEVEEVLVISSSDKDQIYNLMRENVPFYVCSGDSFAEFCDAWTTSNPKSINSERILNAYGSWEVPVKKNPPAGGELDEDGRAVEPECVTTTMKGWVEELRFSSENYLKDYHLYNEVKKRGGDPIYSPTVFCAHDILNPFLDDCTDGDFR